MKGFFSKAWALLKAPAMKAIDKLQATFPVNRVVALLTPTVFMPASAWLAGWAAKHLPGLPVFSASEVDGLMIAGALGALAAGYKWIDGWQKHEERAVVSGQDFADAIKQAVAKNPASKPRAYRP
jgi:hypothetical protein